VGKIGCLQRKVDRWRDSRQRSGMSWKSVFGSPWLGAAGFISFIWGIPGMFGDAAEWGQWFGVVNTGWFYMAAGIGSVLICLWMVVIVGRYWAFIQSNRKAIVGRALAILVLVAGAAAIVAGFVVLSSSESVWTHPTFSKVEQEQALADCRIRAYDAIGGGFDRDPYRRDFVRACLTTKGFLSEELYESERTPDAGFVY